MGNELADELAKRGTKLSSLPLQDFPSPATFPSTYLMFLQNSSHKLNPKNDVIYGKHLTHGRQTKILIPSPNIDKSNSYLKMKETNMA
jgi:hypothetical protein